MSYSRTRLRTVVTINISKTHLSPIGIIVKIGCASYAVTQAMSVSVPNTKDFMSYSHFYSWEK